MNGFLSRCSARNCSFSYSESLTPVLTSLTAAIVNSAVQITVTGTGLSDNKQDYQVNRY